MPSTFILIAANLLPLVGVVFWGWDAFVLLVLYWMETAIIGIWVVVRVLIMRPAEILALGVTTGKGATSRPASKFGTVLFLIAHAGIFMTVHFLFLWSLFAGDWPQRVHTLDEFVREIVIGTGLWAPLLILFFVRGWLALRPMLMASLVPAEAGAYEEKDDSLIGGLYVRIILMQIAIIFGGWIAVLFGASIGALTLLVIGKTLVEVYIGPLTSRAKEAVAKATADRDPQP